MLSLPYSSAGSKSNEMSDFGQNGSYNWNIRSFCAHNRLDSGFDLNIHEIRREPCSTPAPAPSLSANNDDFRLDFPIGAEPGEPEVQGPLSVECFFHSNYEDQSGFKWTGPDPLPIFTLADNLFLYM